MNSDQEANIRVGFNACGVVQGVGFRPWIYNLARFFDLCGFVQNRFGYVRIEVEGKKEQVDFFIKEIRAGNLPKKSRLDPFEIDLLDLIHEKEFLILESFCDEKNYVAIPVDLSICEDCKQEIFDPLSPRYLYPFTTCTQCGPRYTVIQSLPYDRERTTLGVFPLCEKCNHEYKDISDRRFHAESTACQTCGPTLYFLDKNGQKTSDLKVVFSKAVNLILQDKTLAIRGMGGWLLCCNASSQEAVFLLRQRKNRPHKPFAVMAKNIDKIHEIAMLTEKEETILSSEKAPILILSLKKNLIATNAISPDSEDIGLMLPNTALHEILFHTPGCPDYLVMTSGNLSEEPICKTSEEAFASLFSLCDGFLDHNRDIERVCDDSVLLSRSGASPLMIRRSRGYVPEPFRLKNSVDPLLCMGADLKNTIALGVGSQILISQHIGDLGDLKTALFQEKTIADLLSFYRIQPVKIAVDLHPGYHSRRLGTLLAQKYQAEIKEISHHHAHAVSCMAEHGLSETLAVVFDGTGYGTDQTLWGGEMLICNGVEFERVGCLEPIPLVGGDVAIKEIYRQVISRLSFYGLPWKNFLPPALLQTGEWIEKQTLENCTVLTSSAGRVFDCVSWLLSLCQKPLSYEGQAAIRLESLAMKKAGQTKINPYPLSGNFVDARFQIQMKEMFFQILSDIQNKKDPTEISLQFHATMAHACLLLCRYAREKSGICDVVFSGGVFQNRLLSDFCKELLQKEGFFVFFHEKIPANDGGISFGQAVIAGGNPCVLPFP